VGGAVVTVLLRRNIAAGNRRSAAEFRRFAGFPRGWHAIC
jgi:hypothetical protein